MLDIDRNFSGITTDRFFSEQVQQAQNWDKLEKYLSDRGHQFSADPPPQQFVGGFGNLNFLLRMDGEHCVLRRPPLGPLPPGANDMAREFKVTSRLWKQFALAPAGILLCEDHAILGASFLIMEYRPGVVINMEVPHIWQSKTESLSRMVIDVLTRFQAVDPKAVGLDDLGKPKGFLERAVNGWVKRFNVAAADVYRSKEHPTSAAVIMDWLRAQKLPEGSTTLLHNDFKLNNIILEPTEAITPIGLLDWDMCTRGDPLFDFATLLSYWFEPSDPPDLNQIGQMPTATAPGWMSRQDIAEFYAKLSGIDLSDLHFYRVLTAFKLCVIFMQIYARFQRGTTTDPRVSELGTALDSLFEFTHEILKQRVF